MKKLLIKKSVSFKEQIISFSTFNLGFKDGNQTHREVSIEISAINHMFGSSIWDKLTQCIFENFEIALI